MKNQWLSKTGGVQWTALDAIYRTENPRVGGSIPPLATTSILVFRGLTVTSVFRQQVAVTDLCPSFPPGRHRRRDDRWQGARSASPSPVSPSLPVPAGHEAAFRSAHA